MKKEEKGLQKILQEAQDELSEIRAELSRKQKELEMIYRTVKDIHSTLDIKEIAHIIKEILNKVLGLDFYSLMVYDKLEKDFVFQTGKGFSKSVQEQILKQAREHKTDQPEGFSFSTEKKTASKEKHSIRCMSLYAHNCLVGEFCTLMENLNSLSEEDFELITVVATQMAIAVENSILYEMTKRLATTDGLTGLYNYRYFRNKLSGELSRASRYNRPLSLIMLDLDDFKSYNDTYGHPQGDKLLRKIAKILTGNCRGSDIVARYGGEEFVVILPETDEQGAFSVAEKVRQAVKEYRFIDGQKRNKHITISLGVAQNSDKLSGPKDLVKKADEALYKSKQEGKNRTTVGSDI
ncbi:sensor domain-containing diguanylate cyclase [Candidatus Oleimmundimicrobium sp.]|uniref:sensor domain-containing diguanylate cyclase n=1 Tax=Candidatus Oleimmundimicrobium sp. TaxID=3060597 RepID=UPI00271FEBC3|nr:sensor domain-containing diguanylate cyclase [Candidatus Oleimmundimicrobium sp.]MDO8886372.1 sensor domain-containing diguanylate cyclase [Candidatus Oleimmundimicrobium sp.]